MESDQPEATTAAASIVRDSEILGGLPVFTGTRVPVQTLFDHLAAGDSIDEFLDQFPSVNRELAVIVAAAGNECIR